ncbi:hypothetical protein [Leptolyngbya sp. NIES-2104]|uniref:hypothetical protein n=1 Tax=Leptolyngbya sp. NIES-2104 TaxID=1552121 RepID=UPI0006ECBBB3|nr:hypothetical protein [Leptolyngbya sp. NIES-2104]GAP99117.1 hypothetical protein NIES2104_56750 [Leptolyngbya sp. NIES-2104]
MESTHLDPEHVRKIESFVRCLLQGLSDLPEYDRITLLEQAIALEQLSQELRVIHAGGKVAA